MFLISAVKCVQSRFWKQFTVMLLIGASLSEPHTIVVYGTTCIDRPTDRPINRPTDRPCPSHSRDTDTLHVPTLPSRLATHVRHVNSAVRSGDSYKTENVDDGKAKSRDTRATHCEAGTSERPANLFILALPCRCRHASLDFTYVSFSRRLLQTNPFSHFPT